MKLQKLEIRRTESYQTPSNQLVGTISICGESGEQTTVLSAGAISRIIGVISDEVAKTARQNAALTANALQSACDEVRLIESDGALTLPAA